VFTTGWLNKRKNNIDSELETDDVEPTNCLLVSRAIANRRPSSEGLTNFENLERSTSSGCTIFSRYGVNTCWPVAGCLSGCTPWLHEVHCKQQGQRAIYVLEDDLLELVFETARLGALLRAHLC